jgi:RNA-directed DNA polymerase
VLQFTDNLERNLTELQNELMWRTYQQSPYREFYITEPKRRLIMALPFRDRVVQWSIYQRLMPILERKYIYDSYACRSGKGTHAALRRLRYWLGGIDRPDQLYCLKLDVHRYFYRVNHNILVDLYAKWIKDDDLMWLLEYIIRSNDGYLGVIDGSKNYTNRDSGVGMAVGNLLSQLSANVYLNEVDQFVKHGLQLKHYARYQDDMLVLHHEKPVLHEARDAIEDFLLTKLALKTNDKTQIRPIKHGIEWVGYRVWPTHCKLRKSTAKRMKRRLCKLEKEYAAGEVDAETVRQSVQSYIGIMSHCNSYSLRSKLFDELVFARN